MTVTGSRSTSPKEDQEDPESAAQREVLNRQQSLEQDPSTGGSSPTPAPLAGGAAAAAMAASAMAAAGGGDTAPGPQVGGGGSTGAPETLNLPAVLWDKPVGSKTKVPPPVPPRSPRRPMDHVAAGAFEAATAKEAAAAAAAGGGGLENAGSGPQRGSTQVRLNPCYEFSALVFFPSIDFDLLISHYLKLNVLLYFYDLFTFFNQLSSCSSPLTIFFRCPAHLYSSLNHPEFAHHRISVFH